MFDQKRKSSAPEKYFIGSDEFSSGAAITPKGPHEPCMSAFQYKKNILEPTPEDQVRVLERKHSRRNSAAMSAHSTHCVAPTTPHLRRQSTLLVHPALDGLLSSENSLAFEQLPLHDVSKFSEDAETKQGVLDNTNAQGGSGVSKPDEIRRTTTEAMQRRSLAMMHAQGLVHLMGPSCVEDSKYFPDDDFGGNREEELVNSGVDGSLEKRLKALFFLSNMLTIGLVFSDFLLSTFRWSFASDASVPGSAGAAWLTTEVAFDLLHIILYLADRYVVRNLEEHACTMDHRFLDHPNQLLRLLALMCCKAPLSPLTWLLAGGDPRIRLLRVGAILTLGPRFELVVGQLSSKHQVSPLVVRLVENAMVLFGLMHIGSCAWYYCMQDPLSTNTSYLVLNLQPPHSIAGAGRYNVDLNVRDVFPRALIAAEDRTSTKTPFDYYLIGLDWSLKHLCGYGTTGHYPETDDQVILMMFVAFCGISIYAMLLGTVTTYINDRSFNSAESRLSRKLDEVNDALSALNMPDTLHEECRKYYRHVFNVAGTVGNTSILDDLPDSLFDKVNRQMAVNTFSEVPFFRTLSTDIMERLMLELVPKIFLPNIEIIKIGDIGCEALFVQSGQLCVYKPDGSLAEILVAGNHFGENALIAEVSRAVRVTTATAAMLFILTKEAFERVASDFPSLAVLIGHNVRTAARLSFSLAESCVGTGYLSKTDSAPSDSFRGGNSVSSTFTANRIHFKKNDAQEVVTDIWAPERVASASRSQLLEDDGISPGLFLFSQQSSPHGSTGSLPRRSVSTASNASPRSCPRLGLSVKIPRETGRSSSPREDTLVRDFSAGSTCSDQSPRRWRHSSNVSVRQPFASKNSLRSRDSEIHHRHVSGETGESENSRSNGDTTDSTGSAVGPVSRNPPMAGSLQEHFHRSFNSRNSLPRSKHSSPRSVRHAPSPASPVLMPSSLVDHTTSPRSPKLPPHAVAFSDL